MKLTPIKSMLLAALLGVGITAPAAAGTNFLSGALPVGTNTWYRTNEYWLQGAVYALSNTVLRIEAGTVIKGTNTGTFGTNVSALYICQGAKIFAEGTKDRPIIFTTWQDDVSDPDDLGIWDRGLWGGLVVLGRTTINGALDVAGNAATPKYEVYEGLEDIVIGGQRVFRYGGTDDNDDSGVIRYVSIRHGGAKLATDKEINGLSLGAVGRGTTIEFVEVYAIADDGYEFFGGTVNTRYLVSAFCDDDLFDTDMGYRGTNQFWFGISAPDARNYGMELNNQINEIVTTNLLTPQADFSVYNMTLMGAGVTATSTTGGRNAGVILRPYVAPKIYNAIFTDFNERGIELDTRNTVNAAVSVTNGFAVFENTLWWDFVTGNANQLVSNTATNLGRSTVATNYWTNPALTNLIVNPLLAGISRTNNGGLDPRPLAGSPALNPANIKATPKDGFLTPVNYIGAFAPNDLWIEGWTALSEYGILATPFANKQTNFLSGPLPVGTNVWYRTNEYWLQGAVYALSNTVLRIEPGTVIKGTNTGTFGTNVSALYICQGAKIYAEGTPWSPIIFTTWQDDVSDPDDLGIWDRGLWGGLVVLGRTTINGALDVAGNAATPKYEVYEGLEDIVIGGQRVFRYGGTDDNDDSGVIRYVSIRHGGAKLATDKEINGLSLGAVGRGTTIEFVEVYAIADDGYEFFGGTVNTRYLVSAFCDDDLFDTDMGYRGTNQFWFGISAPDARNYGMELNNQINEIVTTNLLTPQANFTVYNLTLVGAGVQNTNTTGGRNAGVILRPYVAPKIYNAIFTDFNERGIELDARNGVNAAVSVTNGFAVFENTLWWDFVTGNANQLVSNTATNLGRSTVATNYWTNPALTNLIVNPLLAGISRTNNGGLDPRPLAGSPALNPANIKATPVSAQLTPAAYIGAIAPRSGNWMQDWTTLAQYNILSTWGGVYPLTQNALPGVGAPLPPPTAPTLTVTPSGSNIVITWPSQNGYSYQLQSTPGLEPPVTWTNEGAPQPGTGGILTAILPATNGNKFFRVLAQ